MANSIFHYTSLEFSDIARWFDDDQASALQAFKRSSERLLVAGDRDQSARAGLHRIGLIAVCHASRSTTASVPPDASTSAAVAT